MPGPQPQDYKPLYPIGFHTLTLHEIESKCVGEFPLSKTRPVIMDGLKKFVARLEQAGLTHDIWLDGSFLTEKIDPKDVDLLLIIDGDEFNSADAVIRDAVNWVIANQKATLLCDSYVHFSRTEKSPLYDEGKWWYAYWHRQWGFSREDDPKGIVVLKLQGNSNESS